jgi:hypothetical protein
VIDSQKGELPSSAAVVIQALGLGGAVASILALPDGMVAPALLGLVGLLALATAWMSPPWRIATATVLAISLMTCAVLVWIGAFDDEPEAGDVTIVRPAAGEAVPPCARVDVQVLGEHPPEGWSYAVAQRDDQDDRYYFEPLRLEGQIWTAEISTFTSPLHLWVVAIDEGWREYLATTTDEPRATYWSSEDWPPGSVTIYDAPAPIAGSPPTECPAED